MGHCCSPGWTRRFSNWRTSCQSICLRTSRALQKTWSSSLKGPDRALGDARAARAPRVPRNPSMGWRWGPATSPRRGTGKTKGRSGAGARPRMLQCSCPCPRGQRICPPSIFPYALPPLARTLCRQKTRRMTPAVLVSCRSPQRRRRCCAAERGAVRPSRVPRKHGARLCDLRPRPPSLLPWLAMGKPPHKTSLIRSWLKAPHACGCSPSSWYLYLPTTPLCKSPPPATRETCC
eukprot:jgi/Botrbrau1/724/Bobra.160_2s0047.1